MGIQKKSSRQTTSQASQVKPRPRKMKKHRWGIGIPVGICSGRFVCPRCGREFVGGPWEKPPTYGCIPALKNL